ncbi:phosphate ABC transporter permease PstA [Arenibaculum pallidiluteum]|uniref:phosphate ABC transporter permease PstA n=1 Tax=Arenibaculum pallidiluteum TaxID=2812559 RepID=UPI001A9726B9|nr:phosphate ABC transporter permease PstA [Arenibaculum pallidiluteum]
MTDAVVSDRAVPVYQTAEFERRLRRRYAAEKRFRLYGIAAIGLALGMLAVLLGSVVAKGYTAFWQHELRLEVFFDPAEIDPQGTRDPAVLAQANYNTLARNALQSVLTDAGSRDARRAAGDLLSVGAAFELGRMVMDDPSLIGTRRVVSLPVSDEVDQLLKGNVSRALPEADRQITDRQLAWIEQLEAKGDLVSRFNTRLFTNGDSREPELAGLKAGLLGSMLTLFVTLVLAVPVGIAAAVYLEEFAPKNRLTDLIEVNINNLAAVPSIVFGLLGLAVFLNFFGMPRSAPLVGGVVLALLVLPTIIIAGRASLKAVPPSIREAALGIGASRLQVVTHHVLPLAMPGIMTGVIIGMAHALGETAPLLMIGMVAFIVDAPSGFTDAATMLPVQIFMWADSPERAFTERTSAAIMVLLGFLIAMNALAVILRKRFERRW